MYTDNGKNRNTDNLRVGNAGLFYCCYRLAQLGWNVLPTSRNAKGIDIVIYGADGKTVQKVQVKTVSKKSAVPLGSNPTYDMSDVVLVCRLGKVNEHPTVFLMRPKEIDKCRHKGDPAKSKNEKSAYWLQYKDYEPHKDRWELIGRGD